MLLIGGEKRFGSGKIVSNVKFCLEKQCPEFVFFSTNGAVMRILLLVKLIWCSQKVIFQPSVYGYSVVRDFLIVCILIALKRQYSILLLCDINASKFPKLLNFLLAHTLCQKVLSCSSPDNLVLKEQVLFRQLEQDQEQYVNDKFVTNDTLPLTKLEMVYGNYLSKEKGLDNFYHFLNKMNIEKYRVFGERRSDDCYDSNYRENVTSSEKEFLQYFELVKDDSKCQCYFYGSMLDLSPLVIETAIAKGFPIITLRGSIASRILSAFLSPDCYTEISDSQISIDTEYLEVHWKNACALIASRPTLIECLQKESN